MVATSVVLAATACSDHDDYNPCPLTTLVVRDTQPGSTFGNEYRCIGDVESSPCFMPTRARVDDYPACEGETVLAIGGSPPGRGLSLYLDISDGDVRSARAQFERFTDDPPPPPPEPAIWGWFLPSEISDDRIAGAFSLQFGDGVVEGLVDTAHGMAASDYQVLSELDVPDDPDDAAALSINIDQDGQGRPDNKLGRFLASIPGFQEATNEALWRGDLLHVAGIPSDLGPLSPVFEWALYEAVDADVPPDPSDDRSGDGRLVARGDAPTRSFVNATFLQESFRGGGGEFSIRLALSRDGTSASLSLYGGGVDAQWTGTGYSGVLGGAIFAQHVDDMLIPALADSFAATVAAQCAPLCAAGSAGADILARFDTNGDGAISESDLRGNPELSEALAPDVAIVLDESFDVWRPDYDDLENNALSVGFGFRTAPVSFTPPGWPY